MSVMTDPQFIAAVESYLKTRIVEAFRGQVLPEFSIKILRDADMYDPINQLIIISIKSVGENGEVRGDRVILVRGKDVPEDCRMCNLQEKAVNLARGFFLGLTGSHVL